MSSRQLRQLTLDCRREPAVHKIEFMRQVEHLKSLLQTRALTTSTTVLSTSVNDLSSKSSMHSKSSVGSLATSTSKRQSSVATVAGSSGGGGGGTDGVASATDLRSLLQFVGALAGCYKADLLDLGQLLESLLRDHALQLSANERQWVLRAVLAFARNSVLPRLQVIKLCFELFLIPDREFRAAMRAHIVADICRVNRAGNIDKTLSRTAQSHVFSLISSPSLILALKALDIVMELYWKRTWNDARTVNVIADACLSSHGKVSTRAIRFFLSNSLTRAEDHGEESDDDDDAAGGTGARIARLDEKLRELQQKARAGRISKKAKAAEKRLMAAMNKARVQRRRLITGESGAAVASRKARKRKRRDGMDSDEDDADGDATAVIEDQKNSSQVNFPAMQLLHSPHDFAERLLQRVRRSTGRFEQKIMTFNLISRLISAHDLQLYDFYPLLQRYMQPHQTHVTALLAIFAQASHPLVDPDVLRPLIRTLADQFIADRSRPEVIAVGLNAIREVCRRAPLAMHEELLHDLAAYSKDRDKAVVAAARSLINLFRVLDPSLLPKKMRGVPAKKPRTDDADGDNSSEGGAVEEYSKASGEEQKRDFAYGAIDIPTRIPGLDYLENEYDEEEGSRDEEEEKDSGDGSDEQSTATSGSEGADAELAQHELCCSRTTPIVAMIALSNAGLRSGGVSGVAGKKRKVVDEEDSEESANTAVVNEENDDSEKNWFVDSSSSLKASSSALFTAQRKRAKKEEQSGAVKPVEAMRFLAPDEFKRLREARERLAEPPSTSYEQRSQAALREAALATHESAKSELVRPSDLAVRLKVKRTKEERQLSVLAGRDERPAFGSSKNRREKHGGISNKAKQKLKNFLLTRNSRANRDKQASAKITSKTGAKNTQRGHGLPDRMGSGAKGRVKGLGVKSTQPKKKNKKKGRK